MISVLLMLPHVIGGHLFEPRYIYASQFWCHISDCVLLFAWDMKRQYFSRSRAEAVEQMKTFGPSWRGSVINSIHRAHGCLGVAGIWRVQQGEGLWQPLTSACLQDARCPLAGKACNSNNEHKPRCSILMPSGKSKPAALHACRVAGNVVNDFVMGSIVNAVQLLGVRLVMVMGHTKCGMVARAVHNWAKHEARKLKGGDAQGAAEVDFEIFSHPFDNCMSACMQLTHRWTGLLSRPS